MDPRQILARFGQIALFPSALSNFRHQHGMPRRTRGRALRTLSDGGGVQIALLDEPWDSEHNRKLLHKMPKLYAALRGPTPKEPHSTYYQVFTGSSAPFSLTSRLGPRPTDFTDWTSQTFLIVEASEAVPWTKPADLVYAPRSPYPNLDSEIALISFFPTAPPTSSRRPFRRRSSGPPSPTTATSGNRSLRTREWVLDAGGP